MSTHSTCTILLSFFLINELTSQPPPRPPLPILPNLPNLVPPLDVLCENAGPCSCPAGTEQPCNINCEGIDACKDGVIDCNNDGYPCTVNCIGDVACSGSTVINGPIGSDLTVNCISDVSCEGSLSINGDKGTDLTVNCDGLESCLGAQFNFGKGVGTVSCTGIPVSCDGATFNLPPNAATLPGVGFSCIGSNCPATAPAPFSNPITQSIITCDGPGPCSCPVGLKDDCSINCIGGADACKDGLIECNNDGYDCFVNCMEMESCGGDTSIMGPSDGALTVQCIGSKACGGAMTVNAETGTDLTTVCKGTESCKGNVQFNFGNGAGSVWCIGDPDSCDGAIYNLPIDAEITPGVSFNCYGNFCPAKPTPFSNPASSPSELPPPSPPPTTIPVPSLSLPPPPERIPIPSVPIPSVPIPSVTIPPPAILPPPVSIPSVLPSGGGSISWCCKTREPNFTPFAGRCWGKTDAASCNGVANDRCIWDEANCFQTRPLCLMTNERCTADNQCCSTVCRNSPSAQGICR